MVDVFVTNGELTDDEIDYFVELEKKTHKGKRLKSLEIELDGDCVNIKANFSEPFQRIRRITGYLVGTLDRFNNAKRAEEKARVKHSTSERTNND